LLIIGNFHPVSPCAATRLKGNEYASGSFPAGDRELGIFAQDQLNGDFVPPVMQSEDARKGALPGSVAKCGDLEPSERG
jgi:hypothetical protein